MIGQTFNRLTVQCLARKGNAATRKWLCLCECGTQKVVFEGNLKRGISKSCGCLVKEFNARRRAFDKSTHTYKPSRIWFLMKQRCYDKNVPGYHNYGGRGITVCKEWLESPKDFCEWYEKELLKYRGDSFPQVDRINNNGPYAPWNCRLATVTENARNRRSTRTVTMFGDKMSFAEAHERFSPEGLARTTIKSRLDLFGWTVEDAFTLPAGKKRGRG